MNFLETLFLRFYCLDLWDIVLIMLGASALYLVLRRFFAKHLWWRQVVRAAFVGWCVVIAAATIVSRESHNLAPSLWPFASYREMMAGGNIEIFRSNFMNVVLFYPAGLLLCDGITKRLNRLSRFLITVATGAVCSAIIESVQYFFLLGKTEADDVIHNTLGITLGALFSLITVLDRSDAKNASLTRVHKLFLAIVKGAVSKKAPTIYGEFTKEDFECAFALAREQKLYGMLVDGIAKTDRVSAIPDFQKHKMAAIGEVMVQAHKTDELVSIYNSLTEAGLHPYVVKGAICRSVYPKGDLRISSDEDIIVPSGELVRAAEHLISLGFTASDSFDESTYEVGFRKKGSPTYIELHSSLFDKESIAFSSFVSLFDGCEERLCTYSVGKGSIRSLSPHDHMLYLVLHAYKHFVHSGFGVRQAMDIGIWSERYFDSINWDKLYKQLGRADALVFLASVIGLSKKFLGVGKLPEGKWTGLCQPATPMLCDMLSGGIYGSADVSRQHSATATLGAIEAEKSGKKKKGIFASLFPSIKIMSARYNVLERYPYLLPLCWIARLFSYLFNKEKGSATASIRIAGERTRLLKYYNVIK